MHRRLLPAAVMALTVAACAGSRSESSAGSLASPAATLAPSSAPSSGVAGEPQPVCAEDGPAPESPPPGDPDDVADPTGRIVFGRIIRVDDVFGQIVSLYTADPDGSNVVGLLDCETARPRFSPDGSQLAFAIGLDDGSFQVATMKVDGSDLRILTSTAGFAETPDWSPDGSWLVYSHASQPCLDFEECVLEDGNLWTLWRMNADGSDQRLIGNADTFDWEPRISPDGTEVVFSRFDPADDFSISLVIRDLATNEERPVTVDDRNLEHPDWSPDGRWIVYNPTDCGTCQQIERVPVDDPDAEPEVLYPGDSTHAGFKPVYAPDGSSIAFGCKEGLCLMEPDGSNPVVVLESEPGAEINHFDWGVAPEGSS